jgi:hypothetical protein
MPIFPLHFGAVPQVEGAQAISASSEAIATTLFTIAWNGTLDVKRLKSERQ